MTVEAQLDKIVDCLEKLSQAHAEALKSILKLSESVQVMKLRVSRIESQSQLLEIQLTKLTSSGVNRFDL